jgi:hypothetical protein
VNGIWKDVALFTIKTLIVILLATISFSVRSIIIDIDEINEKTNILFQKKADKDKVCKDFDLLWKEIEKIRERLRK